MNLINIALLSLAVIHVALVAFVLARNPRSSINRSFSIFVISTALWPLAIAFFNVSTFIPMIYLWDKLIYVSGTLVPLSFIIFTLVITKRNLKNLLLALYGIVGVGFLYLIFNTDYIVKNIYLFGGFKNVELGAGYIFWIIYFTLGMIPGSVILLKRYLKSSGMEKAQLRLVLLSVLFPVVGSYFPNIILPFMGNYGWISVGPFFLTIMILIIFYAIIKHRFLDIRLVVARTVTYSLLLFIFGGFYALGLFVVGSFIVVYEASTNEILVSTLLALVMAFTFQPLRKVLENITSKIFYKDGYDTDLLMHSLALKMAETIDLDSLCSKVISLLERNLHITKAGIYILNKEGSLEGVYKGSGEDYCYPAKSQMQQLNNAGKILVYEELPEGKLKSIMNSCDMAVFMPLRTKSIEVGYLMLGQKTSGDIYFDQDLMVLKILAPELAVALQNSLSFHEIQEFSKVLEGKVEERTKELKEVQRRELDLKDQFVFVASHDLKTPVYAIDGYLSLIKDSGEKLSSDNRENLSAITEASNRLKQLVEDLLEVSRGESGTLKIDIKPVNIIDLVKHMVKEVSPLAKEKSVTIKPKFDEVRPMVLADEEKIEEVFENLLSNAIKFNRKDGRIDISTQRQNGMLKVSIADTGYGIPKEVQGNVFSKFFKSRDDNTKAITGTGLGLFVVRMLVTMMKGRISFTSEVDKGTTFTFTIPLANGHK